MCFQHYLVSSANHYVLCSNNNWLSNIALNSNFISFRNFAFPLIFIIIFQCAIFLSWNGSLKDKDNYREYPTKNKNRKQKTEKPFWRRWLASGFHSGDSFAQELQKHFEWPLFLWVCSIHNSEILWMAKLSSLQ